MNLNIEQLENLVEENHKINTSYRSYNENENFSFDGKDLFSVLDFWHYQYSNIGAFGGALAEFFVARALGIDKAENVNYWTAYDMSYKGKRIEVKSTQYVHPWNKTKISNQRSFSIEPTKNSYWTNKECTFIELKAEIENTIETINNEQRT